MFGLDSNGACLYTDIPTCSVLNKREITESFKLLQNITHEILPLDKALGRTLSSPLP